MLQRIALGTVGLVLGLAVASCADKGQATNPSSVAPRSYATFHCPATIPTGWAPPGESRNPSDFGNGRLWTLVPVDGTLVVTMTRPVGAENSGARLDSYQGVGQPVACEGRDLGGGMW